MVSNLRSLSINSDFSGVLLACDNILVPFEFVLVLAILFLESLNALLLFGNNHLVFFDRRLCLILRLLKNLILLFKFLILRLIFRPQLDLPFESVVL